MGLSNEERYTGMLLNVEEITYSASILLGYEYENLKKQTEALWPALRTPNYQNSNFPLGGSRMTSYENPTYVAFRKIRDKYSSENLLIKYDKIDHLRQCIEMENVINDNKLSDVINIHNYIELFRSYIHRYDDDFSKKFQKVDSIISLIEREVYLIFRDNPKVYDAWIVSNMLKKVINVFDDNDILINFIESNKFGFRLSEQTDGRILQKWYLNFIQNKEYKEFTLTERLEILLTILGRRFYFIGDHKKLLDSLKDQEVDIVLIQLYLNTCIERKREYDEDNISKYNQPCYLRDW